MNIPIFKCNTRGISTDLIKMINKAPNITAITRAFDKDENYNKKIADLTK